MPSYAEIQRSVEAAWRLARGDQAGMAQFDLSVDGFWGSFVAMPLVAPAYALVLIDQYAHVGWPEHPWWATLAEATSFFCGWLAFPIAAVFLTRLLGLSARYVPLIIANNWAAVVQIAIYTGVVLVGAILPAELRSLALLMATLVVLGYQWFVFRTALGSGGGVAAGLVVIDLLLSMAVSRSLDALFQLA